MIVDASVAIKWLVPEKDSELANQLAAKGGLIAPELIAAEIANAVWKKNVRKEISGIPASLTAILRVFDSLEPLAPLTRRATEIALELDHPAYDCFYLALAEATDRKLVTADTRFMNKLAGSRFADRLATLQDILS